MYGLVALFSGKEGMLFSNGFPLRCRGEPVPDDFVGHQPIFADANLPPIALLGDSVAREELFTMTRVEAFGDLLPLKADDGHGLRMRLGTCFCSRQARFQARFIPALRDILRPTHEGADGIGEGAQFMRPSRALVELVS